MDDIYDEIVRLEQEDFQGLIYMRSEVKKDLAPSWSLMGIAKKILGFIMLIGILKMILFPTHNDGDTAIADIQAQIDRVHKMSPKDFQKLNLNETEV